MKILIDGEIVKSF